MTTPTPPTGVTIHTPTGQHTADLTYIGVRNDGLHVWHADTAVPVDDPVRITVDQLPAKTVVMLPLRSDR